MGWNDLASSLVMKYSPTKIVHPINNLQKKYTMKKKIITLLTLLFSIYYSYGQLTVPLLEVEKTPDITLQVPDSTIGKIKILNGQLYLKEYSNQAYSNPNPTSYLTLDNEGNVTQTFNVVGSLWKTNTLAENISSLYTMERVGIGTETPLSDFHLTGNGFVEGNLHLKSTEAPAAIILQRTDGATGSISAAGGSTTIRFDDSLAFRIQTQPKEGILSGVGGGHIARFAIGGSGKIALGNGLPDNEGLFALQNELNVFGKSFFSDKVGVGVDSAIAKLHIKTDETYKVYAEDAITNRFTALAVHSNYSFLGFRDPTTNLNGLNHDAGIGFRYGLNNSTNPNNTVVYFNNLSGKHYFRGKQGGLEPVYVGIGTDGLDTMNAALTIGGTNTVNAYEKVRIYDLPESDGSEQYQTVISEKGYLRRKMLVDSSNWNHSASKHIAMNDFWLGSAGEAKGIHIDSLGQLNFGTDSSAIKLSFEDAHTETGDLVGQRLTLTSQNPLREKPFGKTQFLVQPGVGGERSFLMASNFNNLDSASMIRMGVRDSHAVINIVPNLDNATPITKLAIELDPGNKIKNEKFQIGFNGFFNDAPYGLTIPFTVQENGYVGVGTQHPQETLHIVGKQMLETDDNQVKFFVSSISPRLPDLNIQGVSQTGESGRTQVNILPPEAEGSPTSFLNVWNSSDRDNGGLGRIGARGAVAVIGTSNRGNPSQELKDFGIEINSDKYFDDSVSQSFKVGFNGWFTSPGYEPYVVFQVNKDKTSSFAGTVSGENGVGEKDFVNLGQLKNASHCPIKSSIGEANTDTTLPSGNCFRLSIVDQNGDIAYQVLYKR